MKKQHRGLLVLTSGQFHRKCSRKTSLIWVCKITALSPRDLWVNAYDSYSISLEIDTRHECPSASEVALTNMGKTNTKSTKSVHTYQHYCDVIMGAITSQITSLTIVYSTVISDADRRKHQSSVSLPFMRGIHRGPVNSSHKWPVMRKRFLFDDVIIICNLHVYRRREHTGRETVYPSDKQQFPYWVHVYPKMLPRLVVLFSVGQVYFCLIVLNNCFDKHIGETSIWE